MGPASQANVCVSRPLKDAGYHAVTPSVIASHQQDIQADWEELEGQTVQGIRLGGWEMWHLKFLDFHLKNMVI